MSDREGIPRTSDDGRAAIGCWPGCRRPSRSAPSPIRTASNGRSRPATSPTRRAARWLTTDRQRRRRCDAILFVHAYRADAAATTRRCTKSRSSPPPSRHRGSASSKRPRRAAPSSRPRTAAWPCAALERSARLAGPLAYPVAVALAAAGHGIPLEPALARFPSCGRRQSRFGRRPARPARPDRRPARARRAGAGHRRDGEPRAGHGARTISAAPPSAPTSPHAARDAVHAAVQELTMTPVTTARCASASAARSAPARPR